MRAAALLALTAVLTALGAACRVLDAGLPDAAVTADAGPSSAGGAGGADASRADLPTRDAADVGAAMDTLAAPVAVGPPPLVGCADGSREGFAHPDLWPDIAGCSGGWQIPGLLGPIARAPQCGRRGGDTGGNPAGVGCSVSDLCALGWHVCRDADEVERNSFTQCESAVHPGQRAFFLVLAGASPIGVCSPDPTASNDLHGCGTMGQPGSLGCHPLDRRMSFADCLTTNGPWSCGTRESTLDEASVVVKSGPGQGGALCCRDP